MTGFLFCCIFSTVKLNFINQDNQPTTRWYCESTIQTPGETNCNTEIHVIGYQCESEDSDTSQG